MLNNCATGTIMQRLKSIRQFQHAYINDNEPLKMDLPTLNVQKFHDKKKHELMLNCLYTIKCENILHSPILYL